MLEKDDCRHICFSDFSVFLFQEKLFEFYISLDNRFAKTFLQGNSQLFEKNSKFGCVRVGGGVYFWVLVVVIGGCLFELSLEFLFGKKNINVTGFELSLIRIPIRRCNNYTTQTLRKDTLFVFERSLL